MKKRMMAALALCLVPLALASCLDEKVIEIVLTGETFADFSQNETTLNWTEDAVVDIAGEIRDILEDNGYEMDDLKAAHVTSASYGVTSFSQSHDWTITGAIVVSRDGGPFALVLDYTSQSVQAALGQKIAAPLEPAGVAVINTALDDFRNGQNPVLAFQIQNGNTVPAPSVEDPMIFDWRAWLAIQVVIEESVEVPDPF